MAKMIDMAGRRFGKLVVLYRDNASGTDKGIYWHCQCDCGKMTVTRGADMRNGSIRSCGCLKDEKTSARFKKHGMSNTKLYSVWMAMKGRCFRTTSKDYPDYGARGITICDAWARDFLQFASWAKAKGYRTGLSIDRIDVNGNYCPENCRWTNDKAQANNRTNSRRIEVGGRKYSYLEAGEAFSINPSTIKARIRSGWSADRAVHEAAARGKNQFSGVRV